MPIRGSISAAVELWKIRWEDSGSLGRLEGASARRGRAHVDKEDLVSDELEMKKGAAEEPDDEVEAHGHGGKKAANVEPGDEAESSSTDDDFEAHLGHKKA
jgi:hypothetical protein